MVYISKRLASYKDCHYVKHINTKTKSCGKFVAETNQFEVGSNPLIVSRQRQFSSKLYSITSITLVALGKDGVDFILSF